MLISPMRRIVAQNKVVYYRSDLLWELGVRHAFTTRLGGVSGGPFASMNLGNPSAMALASAKQHGAPDEAEEVRDPDENIAANYRLLHEATGLPLPRHWVHQVHGIEVGHVRRGEQFVSGGPGDILVSDDPASTVTVRAADCAAVLIATRGGQQVAVAHAGWRGVVADAPGAAVRALRERFPGRDVLAAAVFPCIGYARFEVGAEVVEAFLAKNLPARFEKAGPGERKGRADVAGACAELLRRAGVREVEVADLCTYDHPDEFYSHRRDRGLTGRMALFASPRPTAEAA